MLKKFLLGVASSLLIAGAANAQPGVPISDGGDDAGEQPTVTPLELANGTIAFGGAIGDTDVSAVNNSVAARINGNGMTYSAANLVVQVNEFLTGAANDRILLGFGNSGGTTLNSAFTNFGSLQAIAAAPPAGVTVVGNTFTFDLAALGFLAGLNTNNFFDVVVTDDTNIDFFQLNLTNGGVVPLPAALPLMASALIGGAAAMRRRRKQS